MAARRALKGVDIELETFPDQEQAVRTCLEHAPGGRSQRRSNGAERLVQAMSRKVLVAFTPQQSGEPPAGHYSPPVHREEGEQALRFETEAPGYRAIAQDELKAAQQTNVEHREESPISLNLRKSPLIAF